MMLSMVAIPILFLSTLSLRRATAQHFSTLHNIFISIHALLAESDRVLEVTRNAHTDFYPRSPCGERPAIDVFLAVWAVISIHALLAESDYLGAWKSRNIRHFYPRSPCGERPRRTYQQCEEREFLSTLSLRRATTWARGSRVTYVISIHALLAESDSKRSDHLLPTSNFYPRSPCGERPTANTGATTSDPISIHALLAESDRETTSIKPIFSISIHALLAESDILGRVVVV